MTATQLGTVGSNPRLVAGGLESVAARGSGWRAVRGCKGRGVAGVWCHLVQRTVIDVPLPLPRLDHKGAQGHAHCQQHGEQRIGVVLPAPHFAPADLPEAPGVNIVTGHGEAPGDQREAQQLLPLNLNR